MNCFRCTNRREQPGDCHISCSDPPQTVMKIGAGGDERYLLARKAVELARERKTTLVVRCIWPGSGLFPFLFDGGTVFACTNHKGEA